MKRNLINTLQAWMEKESRKPFYMTGIKGVGKTYLACEFAKSFLDVFLPREANSKTDPLGDAFDCCPPVLE